MTQRGNGSLRPALRFVAAGALLFAAAHWSTPRSAAPPPLAVDSDRTDDGLLLREAFALGLADTRTVRGRLVMLAQSLGLAADDDPSGLENEARAIGLERSDPVVRRHLIELTRLAAGAPPPSALPDAATLRAYYAAHAEHYAVSERVRLTQVYFSRARRGDAAVQDAAAVVEPLRHGTADAATLGDGFSRGQAVGPATRDALAREFGPAFAEAAFAAPLGTWSGPLPSSYGTHVVRVEQRLPGAVPSFESVRGRVLHAYLRERGAQRLQDSLALLRQR